MSLPRDLLRLFFPRLCCLCGSPLVGEEREICSRCLLTLPYDINNQEEENHVERRFIGRLPLQAATALLSYHKESPSQQLLHQIKYYGNRRLALLMGRQLGVTLAANPRFSDVDLLVPVPLHRRKERRRGYNQSLLLCQGIVQEFPRPVVSGNLVRSKATATQTRKNREERLDNMRGVFTLTRPEALEGKHVLLVDDVITTGATTEACCQALLRTPGLRVSIAALAIAGDY